TDPAASLRLALEAARLAPGTQTEDVIRSSLLALRERRVIRIGHSEALAAFFRGGSRTLVAGSNGTIRLYNGRATRLVAQAHQDPVTRIAWSERDDLFAVGDSTGRATIRRGSDASIVATVTTRAPIAALSFGWKKLLVGSGARVHIVDSKGRPVRTIRVD